MFGRGDPGRQPRIVRRTAARLRPFVGCRGWQHLRRPAVREWCVSIGFLRVETQAVWWRQELSFGTICGVSLSAGVERYVMAFGSSRVARRKADESMRYQCGSAEAVRRWRHLCSTRGEVPKAGVSDAESGPRWFGGDFIGCGLRVVRGGRATHRADQAAISPSRGSRRHVRVVYPDARPSKVASASTGGKSPRWQHRDACGSGGHPSGGSLLVRGYPTRWRRRLGVRARTPVLRCPLRWAPWPMAQLRGPARVLRPAKVLRGHSRIASSSRAGAGPPGSAKGSRRSLRWAQANRRGITRFRKGEGPRLDGGES
jgi:hypothetical protein